MPAQYLMARHKNVKKYKTTVGEDNAKDDTEAVPGEIVVEDEVPYNMRRAAPVSS